VEGRDTVDFLFTEKKKKSVSAAEPLPQRGVE
jgi:hypothetical protein